MAESSTRDTFLDDAEKIIRECAAKNPKLLVWRGKYQHTYLGEICYYDTILAGLSDNMSAKEPPATPIMSVHLGAGTSTHMTFDSGSLDDTSCSVSLFGAEYFPLKKVRKLAERLREI